MTALPIDPTYQQWVEWLAATGFGWSSSYDVARAAHQAGVEAERARVAASVARVASTEGAAPMTGGGVHRSVNIDIYLPGCGPGGDCEHADECPLDKIAVCAECMSVRTEDDYYALEERPLPDQLAWPCATARAAERQATWDKEQRARFPHDCPRCGAKTGAPCYSTPGHGSHAERPRETGR